MTKSSIPGSSVGKEFACNAGDPSLIPGWGRSPGERNSSPLQYSCLENPINRSLEGYSPWGHKESDVTEQLTILEQMKPKALKKSYDKPTQCIKKQRHCFANKGLSSQSYGFSSSHVWMCELDCEES